MRNENNVGKAWVCIFTCITVTAIDLKLVEDMTAYELIRTLQGFLARIG